MVAKEPMVDGKRPELKRLALVSAVRCLQLCNFLQPNILCRFIDLNCVLFLHGASVDEGGIGRRLVVSL